MCVVRGTAVSGRWLDLETLRDEIRQLDVCVCRCDTCRVRVTRMLGALRRARPEAAERVYMPRGVGAMEAEASFDSARGTG